MIPTRESPRMAEDTERDAAALVNALHSAGLDETLRRAIMSALRQAELAASDPAHFRAHVRWPMVSALLGRVPNHAVVLANGLAIEVAPESRIEQALLLSVQEQPDHVWEPQTTRLLVALAAGAPHVLVGGAYIGDQVLFVARALAQQAAPGVVHAFEPMKGPYERLVRNLALNGLTNVVANRLALWDSDTPLRLEGPAALASASEARPDAPNSAGLSASTTIDAYVEARGLQRVGLIMLDTEGGEERALRGARQLLDRPAGDAPHLVFEVHRNFVDWTNGFAKTPIIAYLTAKGYQAFAIRDFHDNYPMAGKPIEIVPLQSVYLEGPPHGFNVLATKDAGLVARMGLRIVEKVSPKLLVNKDPALHHPLDGLS